MREQPRTVTAASALGWAAAPLLLAAGLLAGCGDDERPSLMLTYAKQNSSEQRMLSDRDQLEHTDGVVQVIESISTDNTITMQLYLDENNSVTGRRRALDLGYQQVRN